jgi:hypothetical protein
MVHVTQHFKDDAITDIVKLVRSELDRDPIRQILRPEMRIAVTCGSRGIDNIALIMREVIRFLKENRTKPFIVPAMGSHGGATAEGQNIVLKHLGITEDYCGCPVFSGTETKQLAITADGEPVFMSKNAAEADGIVLVGRVHSHGDVAGGSYESGLIKMMTIGLGNQQGAEQCHQLGKLHMHERIPMFARLMFDNANILFGLALVENTFQRTAVIRALVGEEIWLEEPALLEKAKSYIVPLLPVPADILITDEIGKDITGGHQSYPVSKSILLDVRDNSEGNCLGMGIYDISTMRLYNKINYDSTYVNTLNSTLLFYGKVPMIMENDRMALQLAMMTCNILDKAKVRMVRIKNDAQFLELFVSENMIDDLKAFPYISIDGRPASIPFNAEGNLF